MTTSSTFTVAIFLIDRAYGGPEEGGWWFTYGEPAEGYEQFEKGFENEDDAWEYMRHLQTSVCDDLNADRPSINSVMSEGVFTARVCIGAACPFPSVIPRYE
jgi:hypothetical protein